MMHWGNLEFSSDQPQRRIPQKIVNQREEPENFAIVEVVAKEERKFASSKHDEAIVSNMFANQKETIRLKSKSLPVLVGPDALAIAELWRKFSKQ